MGKASVVSAATAQADLDDALRALAGMTNPDCGDSAVVNLTGSARRAYHARLDAHYRRYTAACDRVAAARFALAKAQRAESEAARVRYTAADLTGAVVVRDRFGWHEVVRVSAKSVTVKTAWSWTDRIKVEDVLDFRAR